MARSILQLMAANISATSPDGWDFNYSGEGRPHLVHQNASTDIPHVSISHSGKWVACALSYCGPLGVDIEHRRPGRNLAAIAEFSFGPGELRRFEQGGADAFYRIWTIREAIAKATGRGFSQLTDRVDYAASGPDLGHWTAQISDRNWAFAHLNPYSGLSLSLAVPDHKETQLTWWRLDAGLTDEIAKTW